jgi:hypothetical protein
LKQVGNVQKALTYRKEQKKNAARTVAQRYAPPIDVQTSACTEAASVTHVHSVCRTEKKDERKQKKEKEYKKKSRNGPISLM